jgi:hypothetical protein
MLSTQKSKSTIATLVKRSDDGGHEMSQQIISFEELYPIVFPNGVYLVEDLHTSFFLPKNAVIEP